LIYDRAPLRVAGHLFFLKLPKRSYVGSDQRGLMHIERPDFRHTGPGNTLTQQPDQGLVIRRILEFGSRKIGSFTATTVDSMTPCTVDAKELFAFSEIALG
jgi:hypothetical protein